MKSVDVSEEAEVDKVGGCSNCVLAVNNNASICRPELVQEYSEEQNMHVYRLIILQTSGHRRARRRGPEGRGVQGHP